LKDVIDSNRLPHSRYFCPLAKKLPRRVNLDEDYSCLAFEVFKIIRSLEATYENVRCKMSDKISFNGCILQQRDNDVKACFYQLVMEIS